MNSSKFFAGALVGLVAGLLLAPKKGADLRDDIADSALAWKKKLSRMGGQAKTELSDLREILGDEINGLSDDVRLRIMTMLEESEAHAGNIKQNITSELG